MTNALVRVPELGEAEVIRLVNGPEAFTPDGEFILGPTRAARLLGRGRLLRARPGGRGRDGKARRGVDRRRAAGLRRLGDGLAPFRRPLREPRLHARADDRDLLDVLRRQVPRPRAGGRPARCASRPPTRAWSSSAPRSARSRAGSGPTGSSRTRRPATSRSGLAAGRDGCGRPRSAPSTAPAVSARRSSTRRASPRSTSRARARRPSWSGSATTGSRARSGRSPTPRCSTRAAGSSATSRSRASPRIASRIVTGTAFGRHDLAWIRQHAPADGSVLVEDVTSKLACLGLWGPARARDPAGDDDRRARLRVHARARARGRRRFRAWRSA